LFVVICGTITASWVDTVDTTLAGIDTKAIESTVIALFSGINDSITTGWETTACTTSIGSCVAVGCSIITLFTLRIEDSITTLSLTDGAATVEVEIVVIITVLSGVTNTITTCWETAVKTTSTRSAVAVS